MKKLCTCLIWIAALCTGAIARDLPSQLAAAPWPTHHRDFRNSDYTPFPAATELEVAWTALNGYAIITAPVIGRDGTVYISTGRENTGNLHAFSRYGRHRWTHPGVDSKAITSSPIIDERGVLYITDKDQLWAINPDGSTRWNQPVPAPFATAFFIDTKSIGGITLQGDVLLFNRDTGNPNEPSIQLPGAPPVFSTNTIPVWNGLIDPAIVDSIIAGLFGFGDLVANTPAVHPNGKLVLIATGDGYLYGLHVAPGDIHIVYQTPIGGGSGSSPTISADGQYVFFSDGDGNLYAHDALTGNFRWKKVLGKTFASSTIDENNIVYTGAGQSVIALKDGLTIWKNDFRGLATKLVSPVYYDKKLILPQVQPSSALTATPQHLFFQADAGHPFVLSNGNVLTTPRWTGLIILDRRTGQLAGNPIPLRDTGGAVVVVSPDGRVYCPHGSVTTSLANETLNPQLPSFRDFPPATGGLTALRPKYPIKLFKEQILLASLWMNNTSDPYYNDLVVTLLNASLLTLTDAVSKREVSIPDAIRMHQIILMMLRELR
jgi:outer membrane protein assembly factor BamB